jgi:hypothetical protein
MASLWSRLVIAPIWKVISFEGFVVTLRNIVFLYDFHECIAHPTLLKGLNGVICWSIWRCDIAAQFSGRHIRVRQSIDPAPRHVWLAYYGRY